MAQSEAKKYKKMINKYSKMIDDYSDMVDGLYYTDKLIILQKKINYYLENTTFYDFQIKKIEDFCKEIKEVIAERKKTIKSQPTELQLQKMIKDRAKKIGGFIKIEINGQVLHFAKIPFLIWSIGTTPYEHGQEKGDILYDVRNTLVEMWGEPISFSNEKCPNDDEYHSEWIRSIGITPKHYYDNAEKEYKWLYPFTNRYRMAYVHQLVDNKDKPLDFIDSITPQNSGIFEKLYERYVNDEKPKEIKSLPIHKNKFSKFPLYFKPFLQTQLDKDDLKHVGNEITCVVVKNSDESVVDIALSLSDNPNSIIFTNNPSKTAHLINVAQDISLNIFYLDSETTLENNTIYKVFEDGSIEKVLEKVSYGYRDDMPIQNSSNIRASKVSNLAKLYNKGVNVPLGVFSYALSIPMVVSKTQMIARSCGTGEGSSNAKFSGIFKSIKLEINSIENQTLINEVVKSFKSETAKKYARIMNVDVPGCGILYQEFIEADFSYVVKINYDEVYGEKVVGEASKLVNGEAIPTTFEYNLDYDSANEDELFKLIKQIKDTLKLNKVELEIIEKNNIFYVVQAI